MVKLSLKLSLSFKLFCESFEPEKFEYHHDHSQGGWPSQDDQEHVVTHNFALGDTHHLKVSYAAYPRWKKNYLIDFHVPDNHYNGAAAPDDVKGMIYHGVKKSLKTFVDDHNPAEVHFTGLTPKHREIYDKMAPMLAKQLGGNHFVSRHDDGVRYHHIIMSKL
jgi:hypothetical protein